MTRPLPYNNRNIPERKAIPGILTLTGNICPYCDVDVVVLCRRSDGSLWNACFFCFRVERVEGSRGAATGMG